MIIAIDGLVASGKGTLARRLATHYGLAHMDTGLLYRAVGATCLQAELDPDDPDVCAHVAASIDLADFDPDSLRTAEIGQVASKVARHPGVRRALLEVQRRFAAQPGGAVLDGRDIGTVICPNADVKFWIEASVEERARRRRAELNAKGDPITLDAMIAELNQRDARDQMREIAPMKAAADAHLIDTTGLTIDAVVEKARRIIDGVRVPRTPGQPETKSPH